MTVSETIITLLAKAGITAFTASPGTSEISLVVASQRQGIECHVVLHDGVAVGIADGRARATGRSSVCLLHSTQGILNAAGYIRAAHRDNSPVVVLAGAPSTTYENHEPNHYLNGIEGVIQPFTKWSTTLQSPSATRNVITRALLTAQEAPAGPVIVRIPQNILEHTVPNPPGQSLGGGVINFFPAQSVAPHNGLATAATVLKAAKCPLILAGVGAQGSVEEIQSLAETLGAAIVSESLSRGPQIHGVYARSGHPFHCGFYDPRNPHITNVIRSADAILAIGGKSFYKRVIPELAEEKFTIRLATHSSLAVSDMTPNILLLGEIKQSLLDLLDIIRSVQTEEKNSILDATHRTEVMANRLCAARNSKNGPININMDPRGRVTGRFLASVLDQSLPKDAILVDDSQSFSYFIKSFYSFDEPETLYGSHASHLGWSIPAAVGIKMERKKRLVVAISGDTGFAYSVQALHASSAFSAPILVIVVNNGGSKSLELEAKGKSPATGELQSRFAAFATKRNSLRCAPIAEGFGAVTFTLSCNEQLRSGISAAIDLVLGNNQLVVVDVEMDTSDDTWNDSWCVL